MQAPTNPSRDSTDRAAGEKSDDCTCINPRREAVDGSLAGTIYLGNFSCNKLTHYFSPCIVF